MRVNPLTLRLLSTPSLSARLPVLAAEVRRPLTSYYPINDDLYGLSEEQKELKQSAFRLAQKELAPYAGQIDRENQWNGLRDFWKVLGANGLLGITVPGGWGNLVGSGGF